MHVKDLRVLNRDLSQTVIIDNAAYSFAFQIDNGIPIIPYYEGKIDFELKALQAYLESMIFCKDVRELNRTTFSLYRYNEFDNPESLVKELYATSL
jgi:CTD small phosphatase-like protein 2